MANSRSIVWIGIVILAAVTAYFMARRPDDRPRSASGCRVALVTGGSGPFWQLVISGANAAAEDYVAELKVIAPDGRAAGQLRELTALNANDYDGLAISPMDPEALAGRMSRLAEDLKLVTFDSDAPNSERLCYIGTNNHAAGELCARLVQQALPNGGNVVVLFPNFEKDNAVLRHKGFLEGLARPTMHGDAVDAQYTVLATMNDDIVDEKCVANIKQALADHTDLACFVGLFGYHGPVLMDVRKQGELPDTVKLVVFDEDERVLQGIEDGAIYGTVIQDPYKYGYESVRMLTALYAGRSNELPIANRGSLFLACESVTADNVGSFRERLRQRTQTSRGPDTTAAEHAAAAE